MSTLHTLSKSPQSGLLASCLSGFSQGDALLFLEDGVFHCLDKDLLASLPKGNRFFALKEDLRARGLENKLPANIDAISTKKFIALCCSFDKVVNWF